MLPALEVQKPLIIIPKPHMKKESAYTATELNIFNWIIPDRPRRPSNEATPVREINRLAKNFVWPSDLAYDAM